MKPMSGSNKAKTQVGKSVSIRTVLDAVVITVTVAPEPDGAGAQVGARDGDGETEQLNVTAELKPPVGLTVTVPVDDCPALTVLGDRAEAIREKSGGGGVALKLAFTDWSEFIMKVH